ncbi:RICIN domain-containing protein [Arenibacter certesii]|uniref:Ricin B lectin domain-containing protein n=1 Tax=Arenibacter certesii TaxID=228955 RepID=A0A918MQL2_9FLAO|nr:RICIN domain-containing protein [Arenibacter certesii]GGW44450.1 hypothetical protein GCM10007383_31120 [Arenibacter certesii]
MASYYLKFQVKSSLQYLNILDCCNMNGAWACQGNAPTSDNFLWQILYAPKNTDWYLIQVKSSGQYLNVLDDGHKNGNWVGQGILIDSNNAPDNFLWKFSKPDKQGWFKIQVKSSKQYLNILNASNKNGQPACQGDNSEKDNFLWQKNHATNTITISATTKNPTPLVIHDDEGDSSHTHHGDDELTTKVTNGDTVIWQFEGDISCIDNVFERPRKDKKNDLFRMDPMRQRAPKDGIWLGVIGSLPPGSEESYAITYTVNGKHYTQDPKLKMR